MATGKNNIIDAINNINTIEPNAKKVRYLKRVMENSKLMPSSQIFRKKKNNDAARQIRQKGNQLFALQGLHFIEALKLYNQSLCWAELGSPDFAIALANRSAVYFELRMTRQCIENIRAARNTGAYPERLMEKLTTREADCALYEEQIKEHEEWLKPKTARLKLAPHADVPFIAGALELRVSPQYGRHVVTNKRLVPGDVLAVEKPFTHQLDLSMRHQRCWHCMCEYAMNLLPCNRCTAVMFCSETCRDEADATYHAFECPIIDCVLVVFSDSTTDLLVLRMALMGVVAFGSLMKLKAFLDEFGDRKVDAFSASARSMEEGGVNAHIYASDLQREFHQLYSLQTHQEKTNSKQMCDDASMAAVLYDVLSKHTLLATEIEAVGRKAEDTLMELLFHFTMICSINFECLYDSSDACIKYGSKACPFGSLMNHSCAPNVAMVTIAPQHVLVATRVIGAGEQLFINYNINHRRQPLHVRRKNLMDNFHFHCECEACRVDMPMHLESATIPWNVCNNEDYRKLLTHSLDSDHLLDKYSSYLQRYDGHYPCKQLETGLYILKKCFKIMLRDVSMTDRMRSKATKN